MNHILEIVLFIILFILFGYLFLVFIGLYSAVEEAISNSELKMNDQINELKIQIAKLQKDVGK